jgi:hypothetical protein
MPMLTKQHRHILTYLATAKDIVLHCVQINTSNHLQYQQAAAATAAYAAAAVANTTALPPYSKRKHQ